MLIACPPGDGHALAVAVHLAELGLRAVPLDVGRLHQTGIAARFGAGRPGRLLLGTSEGFVDPAACAAVWWRRPKPVQPPELDAPARRLADGEWTAAIGGLASVAGGFWVNDPRAEELARRKIVQLEAARLAGLRVPRTLVTNDLATARAFVRGCRSGAVIKSLSSLREGGYSRRLTANDERLAARLRAGPAILQERIDGLDLRVVVAGRALFAMSLDARAGGDPDDVRADWEKVQATARAVRLPRELARRLLLFQRRLGLRFGALDLRRRRGGEWMFLEVNPSGQWLHMEAAIGAPIGAALARLLASGAAGTA